MTTKNFSRFLGCVLFFASAIGQAQAPDERLIKNLDWRSIGPAVMGGRIDDVAVVEQNPSTIYIGAASGGVWKTTNNGTTWEPIFDHESVASIGDLAIAPSDPNIVWAGTGEPNNRQSSSFGDGIYKSTDAGKNWTHMGLRDSQSIGRIVIDPTDPNIVYVAALGHLWGSNKERGLFKTTDGGLTWASPLFINEDTGVSDVAMHPANRQVLYAAAYQRRRTAWGFNGGGPHGGIHKTTDGGKTWKKLGGGLPEGIVGRIGLDVTRSKPDVVYAVVEHREGGIFRSDDAGETWRKMSVLNNRPMYYSQIRIDPNDDKRIYSLGAFFWVSTDGGDTFVDPGSGQPGANRAMAGYFDVGVHSDFHGLWIDPHNSNHLVLGGDGGLYFSYDASVSWDHVDNIPIGQFYAIGVDMRKPYYIYGGMQDNHSWGGPSATRYHIGITGADWYQLDSGDGMYHQVDPTDYTTIYSEPNGGALIRFDLKTGDRKSIRPNPPAGEPPYRFNWTPPLQMSPHDPKTIYLGGNHLFTSRDRGETWTASPDLTKAEDRDELPIMGVLPSADMLSRHDGVSAWGTLTTLAESPVTPGVFWVGTDDGNLQLSRDGGKSWVNVVDRVSELPPRSWVSRVEPSHHDTGTAYVAFDRHQNDDFAPYIYRTTDFGETWAPLANNLPDVGWVNVVKEHPKNPRLLLAGTETGAFVSLDGGGRWLRLPNLPTVPVDDIVIHPRDNDLILGTHGRALYILDDMTPLSGLTEDVLQTAAHLFEPRPARIFLLWKHESYGAQRQFIGPNPPHGAIISYYLEEPSQDGVRLTILDAQGKQVRELTGTNDAGINRAVWDLRLPPPDGVPDSERVIDPWTRGWQSAPALGAFVLPGKYTVKLSAAGREATQALQVEPDPDLQVSDADREARLKFLVKLNDLRVTVQRTITTAEDLETQTATILEQLKTAPNVPADTSAKASTTAEQVHALHQKLAGRGGFAMFGGNLRAKMGRLVSEMEGTWGAFQGTLTGPTIDQERRLTEISAEVETAVSELNRLSTTEVPSLSEEVKKLLGQP